MCSIYMHAELLVRVLAAIEPEKVISLDNFQQACAISSKSVAKSVLDYLQVNNIGYVSKKTVKFSGYDRIHVAVLALQMRCDIEQVSTYLSWKDFEKLASEVLRSFGYRTSINVRFAKPRMEIDVVGTSSDGFTIAVDCKHWKRSNLSSISNFSQKQAVRARWLIKYQKTISQVVPVVLTLHAESISFINGVPLVPIHKFRSFIMDVKGFLPEMYVVSASRS
ncbi:MAG TPA: restriction endonuclease [Nitrososphaera sp.]|nr:restriction endonuclease [Nitrososphaera sp.]